MNIKTHGQIAYDAYFEHCEGKSIRGEDLPAWNDQASEIRDHWEAAAWAVGQAVYDSKRET
jgi:hypothetical protein